MTFSAQAADDAHVGEVVFDDLGIGAASTRRSSFPPSHCSWPCARGVKVESRLQHRRRRRTASRRWAGKGCGAVRRWETQLPLFRSSRVAPAQLGAGTAKRSTHPHPDGACTKPAGHALVHPTGWHRDARSPASSPGHSPLATISVHAPSGRIERESLGAPVTTAFTSGRRPPAARPPAPPSLEASRDRDGDRESEQQGRKTNSGPDLLQRPSHARRVANPPARAQLSAPVGRPTRLRTRGPTRSGRMRAQTRARRVQPRRASRA